MKSEKSQYHRVSCIGGIKTKQTRRKGNRASVTGWGVGFRGGRWHRWRGFRGTDLQFLNTTQRCDLWHRERSLFCHSNFVWWQTAITLTLLIILSCRQIPSDCIAHLQLIGYLMSIGLQFKSKKLKSWGKKKKTFHWETWNKLPSLPWTVTRRANSMGPWYDWMKITLLVRGLPPSGPRVTKTIDKSKLREYSTCTSDPQECVTTRSVQAMEIWETVTAQRCPGR